MDTVATIKAHRLMLHDRNDDGGRHRYRWAATCSCGVWWALSARTRDLAAGRHRDHVRSERRSMRRRTRWPTPRPVTADADLPAELRRLT